MSQKQLKPKDKVVMRMSRDGAIEENLTEGTSERISQRLEDAQLVASHEAEAVNTETAKHKQPIQERLLLRKEEKAAVDANAPAPQAQQEYKPGELPVVRTQLHQGLS